MIRRAAVLLAWCSAVLDAAAQAAPSSQPAEYGIPAAVCEVQDSRVTEASGIVASRRNPGCYYVHNDSGDAPRVYLIDRTGRTRLTINLRGARAVDYEDIALAPGRAPGTFDVCVADIGDNAAKRSYVTIYRFAEVELKAPATTPSPSLTPDAGRGVQTGDAPSPGLSRGGGRVVQPGAPKDERDATIEVETTAYRVRYADGPADAEAFCVHPRTADGYILTKHRDGRSAVYKLAAPWDAERETVLPRVAMLDLPTPRESTGVAAAAERLARIVTAADIRPDGQRLAVRCYIDGWEWQLPAGVPDRDFDHIFATPPARLRLAAEPQGEGLCYAADGAAILTISEGAEPTVFECKASAAETGR